MLERSSKRSSKEAKRRNGENKENDTSFRRHRFPFVCMAVEHYHLRRVYPARHHRVISERRLYRVAGSDSDLSRRESCFNLLNRLSWPIVIFVVPADPRMLVRAVHHFEDIKRTTSLNSVARSAKQPALVLSASQNRVARQALVKPTFR